MRLNEGYVRKLIRESISRALSEAEGMDPDTGLPLSAGGRVVRDMRADASSRAREAGMFEDVTSLSRLFRFTIEIASDIKQKVKSYRAGRLNGDYSYLVEVPGDERLVTIALGGIVDEIRVVNPDIVTIDDLEGDRNRNMDAVADDGPEMKVLTNMIAVLTPVARIAEKANSPAYANAYIGALQNLEQRFPVYSSVAGVGEAIKRAQSLDAAGLGEGIASEIEALVSYLVSSGGGDQTIGADLIQRAAPVLQKVMDGKAVLKVGSSGPAVEVLQKLLEMTLDRFSRELHSPLKRWRVHAGQMKVDQIVSAAYDAADLLAMDGFDGKFGENTKKAVEVMQTILQARQGKGTLKKGGVYTYDIENPAVVDGVVGSQTLGALVRGDFNKKVSSIISQAKESSDKISVGTDREQPAAGDLKQEVLDVFDDVALEATGESPDQVAQYRVGLNTILRMRDFSKYERRGYNSRQIATSAMTDFNFPDDLVGAPGLVDALARYIDSM